MSIDEIAWLVVEDGWTWTIVIVTDGIIQPKKMSKYTTEEHRATHGNSKALNAIFSGVDMEKFKLISSCEYIKEAWEIL